MNPLCEHNFLYSRRFLWCSQWWLAKEVSGNFPRPSKYIYEAAKKTFFKRWLSCLGVLVLLQPSFGYVFDLITFNFFYFKRRRKGAKLKLPLKYSSISILTGYICIKSFERLIFVRLKRFVLSATVTLTALRATFICHMTTKRSGATGTGTYSIAMQIRYYFQIF